jgi:predicted Zn-dependent protease
MIKFISFISLFIFVGCATSSKTNSISNSENDGLRFESFSRYNLKRLETIKDKAALISCHSGKFTESLDKLKQSLDKEKNNPKYWNKIATCYLLKQELPKAKFYFDLALKTSGKDTRTQAVINNNLGLYFNLLGKESQAVQAFLESSKLQPSFLTPKYNLSTLYLRFGLYKKASKLLDQLYKKAPKDIDFLANMGHLNLMTGKYKQSIWFYNKIPSEFAKRDSIATNYAMALLMQGDHKKAKQIIDTAESSDSYYSVTQTQILKKIKYENK